MIKPPYKFLDNAIYRKVLPTEDIIKTDIIQCFCGETPFEENFQEGAFYTVLQYFPVLVGHTTETFAKHYLQIRNIDFTILRPMLFLQTQQS